MQEFINSYGVYAVEEHLGRKEYAQAIRLLLGLIQEEHNELRRYDKELAEALNPKEK